MQFPTWKDALWESVHRSEANPKQIAEACGVSLSALYQFCDPVTDTHIPGRRLPALARSCSNTAWLAHLAALAGCVVFRVPRGQHMATTGEAVRQFGEWLTTHADVIEDGQVSSEEFATLEREAHEAIAAIAAAVDHARGQVPASPLKAVR